MYVAQQSIHVQKIYKYMNEKNLIVFRLLGDNGSFKRAALLFPSRGRFVVSGAEIKAAGGGRRRRILTTFMKESRAQAMTSWETRGALQMFPLPRAAGVGERNCLSLSAAPL